MLFFFFPSRRNRWLLGEHVPFPASSFTRTRANSILRNGQSYSSSIASAGAQLAGATLPSADLAGVAARQTLGRPY